MDDIILGQYVPGSSAVHRLDPRSKLLLTTVLVLLVFLVKSWWGFAAFFGFVGLLTVVAQIPPGFLLRGMQPMFLFTLVTFIFQVLFEGSGSVLWQWGVLQITDQGLVLAFYMCFRLLLVILVVLLMTLTTSTIELSEGIERLFRPMNRFGLNSYELALVASGALRFVPTLLEQAEKVKRAQTARGVNFEQGNLWVRTRKMLPLLAPLFLNAVRRAEDLGMAMEARCYRGGVGRVSRRRSVIGRLDYTAYLVSVAFAALLVGFGL